MGCRVITEYTVGYCRAAIIAEDSPSGISETVCNGKTGKHRISVFAACEVKGTSTSLTINNRLGDNAGVCWDGASDSYGFPEEIDISVAWACVCAGEDKDKIAIAGIVNCILNVIK